MPFRFVHAADIHLDSPLRSLALRDSALAELIGNATRRAFVRIIDLCLDERVDALLIAGDLYDGDQTSMKTARFLAEQLRRLDLAGIRCFILRGNHDAMSRITKELTFPEGVKVFGGSAEAIRLHDAGGMPIAIHGLSFTQPHAPESLIGKYRPPIADAVNIGMMHTSLGGSAGHDLYAPCSVADLQATGFRYWALGHVHKRSVIDGACTVVMPGMPQGRDINEAGTKSVTLVTVGDDGSVRLEERPTGFAQFERISVDATGMTEWSALVSAARSRLERHRASAISEQLVVRLDIVGETPLAWRIRRDLDLMKTELDVQAGIIGNCWVEKLETQSQAPGDTGAGTGDPLMVLRQLITDDVLNSDDFRLEFAKAAEELRAQLPPECRDSLGRDEAQFQALSRELAHSGVEEALARLHASAGEA